MKFFDREKHKPEANEPFRQDIPGFRETMPGVWLNMSPKNGANWLPIMVAHDVERAIDVAILKSNAPNQDLEGKMASIALQYALIDWERDCPSSPNDYYPREAI